MTIQGVIHGRTIELSEEPGLPDGQAVSVEIQPFVPPALAERMPAPWWLECFAIDPDVKLGKWVVKGTRLLAESMVQEFEQGRTDAQLLQTYAELTGKDVAALREYAKLPLPMRRLFGAWAEEAEEVDDFLEERRRLRRLVRREVDE
jgi:uncharacterized protein (DUF433 family)